MPPYQDQLLATRTTVVRRRVRFHVGPAPHWWDGGHRSNVDRHVVLLTASGDRIHRWPTRRSAMRADELRMC
jgi:hypothetical protein